MTERHATTRIRRETRRRTLTVAAIEQLGPHMLRLHFTSDDLADFDSASPDDHIKLFVADGAGGQAMRDYTPRAWDKAAGTFLIDFALHEAGPATRWAIAAKVGDTVEIGGPRGSAVVTDDFDWYLLVGDETALPSIARRLEELRDGVPVTVLALVDGEADILPLPARPGLTVRWATRAEPGDDAGRLTALLEAALPGEGEGYVWIAAEAEAARALRTHVTETLGHPKAWTKAAGYWIAGAEGQHQPIED